MKIAVLGGGCVGLTAATLLQEELRNNVKIDVIAENFEETTSHVAAGIFRVGAGYTGPTEDIAKKWVTNSFEYYSALSRSSAAAVAGVANLSGYIYTNDPPEKNPFMEQLLPLYRSCTKEELQLVGGEWKYGTFMSTLLTQPNIYLPWARQRLIVGGAKFITRHIESLKELVKDYDLIMNCTGLGARKLCQDKQMVPIGGQVIKVKAPWIKTFFYGDLITYIIPGADGLVTLGGNREYGSHSRTICKHQASAIRERCENLIPSLKKAKTVMHKQGLRPHREGGTRVAPERIRDGVYSALVIHNYGHSGYGICTAPGTSKYAVELAKDAHKSSAKL